MSRMKSLSLISFVIVAFLCPRIVPQGVVQSYTDATTPELVKAGTPAGSYLLSGADAVNLYNGSLTIRLPLVSVGGRGTTGYKMYVPIYQRWRTQWYQDSSSTAVNVVTQNTTWLDPVPYYSPGVMTARVVGSTPAGYCVDNQHVNRKRTANPS